MPGAEVDLPSSAVIATQREVLSCLCAARSVADTGLLYRHLTTVLLCGSEGQGRRRYAVQCDRTKGVALMDTATRLIPD